MLIPLLYIVVFKYVPMYGAQLAFKEFNPTKGIFGSPWIGFTHFRKFFESYQFQRVLLNTISISAYSLAMGFPFPIILALLINEVKNRPFKKSVQMITYIPYFISTVVMVSIIMESLHPRLGSITSILRSIGIEIGDPLGDEQLFQTIYVFSNIWQNTGYSSIVYIAALAGIDPSLHEAAVVDGATKVQRIWFIDIPGILPTAIILLILHAGSIMNVGFEKIFLMQNNLNLRTSEVISTYVYKVGLINADFSFSTAVGFFNSLVNMLLLFLVNRIARKTGETSLW